MIAPPSVVTAYRDRCQAAGLAPHKTVLALLGTLSARAADFAAPISPWDPSRGCAAAPATSVPSTLLVEVDFADARSYVGPAHVVPFLEALAAVPAASTAVRRLSVEIDSLRAVDALHAALRPADAAAPRALPMLQELAVTAQAEVVGAGPALLRLVRTFPRLARVDVHPSVCGGDTTFTEACRNQAEANAALATPSADAAATLGAQPQKRPNHRGPSAASLAESIPMAASDSGPFDRSSVATTASAVASSPERRPTVCFSPTSGPPPAAAAAAAASSAGRAERRADDGARADRMFAGGAPTAWSRRFASRLPDDQLALEIASDGGAGEVWHQQARSGAMREPAAAAVNSATPFLVVDAAAGVFASEAEAVAAFNRAVAAAGSAKFVDESFPVPAMLRGCESVVPAATVFVHRCFDAAADTNAAAAVAIKESASRQRASAPMVPLSGAAARRLSDASDAAPASYSLVTPVRLATLEALQRESVNAAAAAAAASAAAAPQSTVLIAPGEHAATAWPLVLASTEPGELPRLPEAATVALPLLSRAAAGNSNSSGTSSNTTVYGPLGDGRFQRMVTTRGVAVPRARGADGDDDATVNGTRADDGRGDAASSAPPPFSPAPMRAPPVFAAPPATLFGVDTTIECGKLVADRFLAQALSAAVSHAANDVFASLIVRAEPRAGAVVIALWCPVRRQRIFLLLDDRVPLASLATLGPAAASTSTNDGAYGSPSAARVAATSGTPSRALVPVPPPPSSPSSSSSPAEHVRPPPPSRRCVPLCMLRRLRVGAEVSGGGGAPVVAAGTAIDAALLHAARSCPWVPLVEKAAAKMFGSYAALAGGTFATALEMLFGGSVVEHAFPDLSAASVANVARADGSSAATALARARHVGPLSRAAPDSTDSRISDATSSGTSHGDAPASRLDSPRRAIKAPPTSTGVSASQIVRDGYQYLATTLAHPNTARPNGRDALFVVRAECTTPHAARSLAARGLAPDEMFLVERCFEITDATTPGRFATTNDSDATASDAASDAAGSDVSDGASSPPTPVRLKLRPFAAAGTASDGSFAAGDARRQSHVRAARPAQHFQLLRLRSLDAATQRDGYAPAAVGITGTLFSVGTALHRKWAAALGCAPSRYSGQIGDVHNAAPHHRRPSHHASAPGGGGGGGGARASIATARGSIPAARGSVVSAALPSARGSIAAGAPFMSARGSVVSDSAIITLLPALPHDADRHSRDAERPASLSSGTSSATPVAALPRPSIVGSDPPHSGSADSALLSWTPQQQLRAPHAAAAADHGRSDAFLITAEDFFVTFAAALVLSFPGTAPVSVLFQRARTRIVLPPPRALMVARASAIAPPSPAAPLPLLPVAAHIALRDRSYRAWLESPAYVMRGLSGKHSARIVAGVARRVAHGAAPLSAAAGERVGIQISVLHLRPEAVQSASAVDQPALRFLTRSGAPQALSDIAVPRKYDWDLSRDLVYETPVVFSGPVAIDVSLPPRAARASTGFYIIVSVCRVDAEEGVARDGDDVETYLQCWLDGGSHDDVCVQSVVDVATVASAVHDGAGLDAVAPTIEPDDVLLASSVACRAPARAAATAAPSVSGVTPPNLHPQRTAAVGAPQAAVGGATAAQSDDKVASKLAATAADSFMASLRDVAQEDDDEDDDGAGDAHSDDSGVAAESSETVQPQVAAAPAVALQLTPPPRVPALAADALRDEATPATRREAQPSVWSDATGERASAPPHVVFAVPRAIHERAIAHHELGAFPQFLVVFSHPPLPPKIVAAPYSHSRRTSRRTSANATPGAGAPLAPGPGAAATTPLVLPDGSPLDGSHARDASAALDVSVTVLVEAPGLAKTRLAARTMIGCAAVLLRQPQLAAWLGGAASGDGADAMTAAAARVDARPPRAFASFAELASVAEPASAPRWGPRLRAVRGVPCVVREHVAGPAVAIDLPPLAPRPVVPNGSPSPVGTGSPLATWTSPPSILPVGGGHAARAPALDGDSARLNDSLARGADLALVLGQSSSAPGPASAVASVAPPVAGSSGGSGGLIRRAFLVVPSFFAGCRDGLSADGCSSIAAAPPQAASLLGPVTATVFARNALNVAITRLG
jgi:hypothetical protein